jgi:hypothetical protein
MALPGALGLHFFERDQPMRQRPFLVLLLALSLSGSALSTRAQDPSAGPTVDSEKAQQSSGASAPAQNPAPNAEKSKPPSAGGDAPKPAATAHHVITNEDIEAEHERTASANSDVDIGNINDCDAICFNAVHMSANYYIIRNSDWKHDLLRGIDEVTEDAAWQSALYQIARLKAKLCDLSQDKNDALANVADPRKMTEDEIAVDEDYDRKFQAIQVDVNAANAQADALIRTHSGVIVSFMGLQKQRASNRVCVIRYPVMYRPYRPPLDDPDRP